MIQYPLYVTLDTNIIQANKYDFGDDSTLGLLAKYVEAGKLKVVLSNIVIREVEKHIISESNKVCAALRKTRTEILKSASEEYLKQLGLDRPLELFKKEHYQERSLQIWHGFFEKIRPEILDTSRINIDSILDDYFEINPPFQIGEKKRKEFPDAFIANQIRERFSDGQPAAVVSNDAGFRKACGTEGNFLFFSTLGDLFNILSQQETEYEEIVKRICAELLSIALDVEATIKDDDCVEVHGLSCDKDAVWEGFEYSETSVLEARNTVCKLRTIDEITEDHVWVTLICRSEIEVECCYEDYDNAVWDRETNSYLFLETIRIIEKHNARFGVRVEIDRASNQLRMIPFKVILNGDTLQERRELDDNDEIDFINQDREELGFHSLGNYDDFLEDNLSGSSFAESVVELFERINQYYRELEEIAAVYDDLLNQLQTEKATLTAKLLAKGIGQTETFPLPENVCVISEEEIDAIINWANHCFERLSEYGERDVLPDTFTYGDAVTIDAGETQYRFVLGDLPQNLTAGDEASIDLVIYNKAGEAIANGEVKLTVGYLNFDEDGGAADGISDEIEYSTEPVVYALKEIAESIQNLVENEKKIASVIEKTITESCEIE